MAVASREDRDLTARIRRRSVRFTRGDVRARRPWRVMHEVRRPSAAKRKTALHTIGRVSRDPLRAPTCLMDEVTRTEVPGERLHIMSEGSWGRHLPRNEDLLDMCGWRARQAELFSAHGTTSVAAPRGLWRRLRLWWGLTRRFEHYADLRNLSLTEVEPRIRARYVQGLRALGARIEFRPHAPAWGEANVSAHVRSLFEGAT